MARLAFMKLLNTSKHICSNSNSQSIRIHIRFQKCPFLGFCIGGSVTRINYPRGFFVITLQTLELKFHKDL